MKRFILTLGLLVVIIGITGCGASGPVREVTVTMGPGMVFTPAELTGTVGERLLIKVTNADDALEHDMVMAAFGSKVRLKPGESGQTTVALKKAGTFDIRCTLPGHTDAGMVGSLRVVAR